MLLQTTHTSSPPHTQPPHTIITKDLQLRLNTDDKQILLNWSRNLSSNVIGLLKLIILFYNLPLNGMIIKRHPERAMHCSLLCVWLWKTKTFQASKSQKNELWCCSGLPVANQPFLVLIKQDSNTFLNSLNPQNILLLCYLIIPYLRSLFADLD